MVRLVVPAAFPVRKMDWVLWSIATATRDGSAATAVSGLKAEPTTTRPVVPIATWAVSGETVIGGGVGLGVGAAVASPGAGVSDGSGLPEPSGIGIGVVCGTLPLGMGDGRGVGEAGGS